MHNFLGDIDLNNNKKSVVPPLRGGKEGLQKTIFMSNFSLDTEMDIEVIASFIAKGSDAPVTGSGYEFRLYEKDFMEDDYLGVSPLNENGSARVSFKRKDYMDFLNPEKNPDLYFALYNNDSLVFQSKVAHNVDIEGMKEFVLGEGKVIDLGVFLIDA